MVERRVSEWIMLRRIPYFTSNSFVTSSVKFKATAIQ